MGDARIPGDIVRLLLPCPAEAYWLSQGWGENPHIYSRWGYPGHNGLDFAYGVGTPVFAVAAGRITICGWDEYGYGEWVEIQHEFGRTRYAHGVPESTTVRVGQDVDAGTQIMLGGSTGFSTGPHLHFEIRVADNPARYGVDYMPTRSGSFCIDPTKFIPLDGYAEEIGDIDVDERVTKLEAELRQERARADLNYNKMIDGLSDLGWTVRALNRATVLDADKSRLSDLNHKWVDKI